MLQPTPPSLQRAYYAATVPEFLATSAEACLGAITQQHGHFFSAQDATATHSWLAQIQLLQAQLPSVQHLCQKIYFEFTIPRVGRRVDVLLLLHHHVVLLEFKVGENAFPAHAQEQVWDYALDLRHFHATSQHCTLTPVLVCTQAPVQGICIPAANDGVRPPIPIAGSQIAEVVQAIAASPTSCLQAIDSAQWESGSYQPSPSILEAALALYQGHQVQEISRSDASGQSLQVATSTLRHIIHLAHQQQHKVICFVTGVPGAGKTLVGLNLANTSSAAASLGEHGVYLSGNGPLVDILREALANDLVRRESVRKTDARQRVNPFIQNVHHFRDECLRDHRPPHEHVVIFDEAQRAWDQAQTSKFMQAKKGQTGFNQSEPAFLIACLDRHPDWAVIVCLVGGGQEINTGEAGILAWLEAVADHHPDWQVYIAPELHHTDYGGAALASVLQRLPQPAQQQAPLHLTMSMRSFRASHVSAWVHSLLALDSTVASQHLQSFHTRFPIRLTRDVLKAKQWLRQQARGSERYGLLASSQALRLKPLGLHVKAPLDPVHWFLKGKDDVRASYALEDAATEFHVQGLELDWTCVVWDADLRLGSDGWQHHSFKGSRWTRIQSDADQRYLLNAYRVLLTRARQGMVMVVPNGDAQDPTRAPHFYDPLYQYLQQIGITELT